MSTTTAILPGTYATMSDRDLVDELAAAARRPHVNLDDDERRFVSRIRGKTRLSKRDRKRAEGVFGERVDW